MSGHSKWAQIKHKKASVDAKRGREFSKFIQEIMVAARTGGPNEDANPRLRAAIERARSLGLPKDNIERAVARATGSGDDTKLEEFLYEATAPNGLFVLIEGITDNKNRTLAEIKKILTGGNAKLADPGSVFWNFEKIGSFEVSRADNPGKSPEHIENAIIESGAQDMTSLDKAWIVKTKFEECESVRKALEERMVKINTAGHDYKNRATVILEAAAKKSFEQLLNSLTGLDDVQEVYTNLHE